MSTERHTCYTVSCDACRSGLEDRDEGFTPHFDTEDAAIGSAADDGWHVDIDGHLYCPRCIAAVHCLTDGHDYGPWIPCHCAGRVPGHDTHGCGLFRSCCRDGCDFYEDTDLAHLPTTTDPPLPGR